MKADNRWLQFLAVLLVWLVFATHAAAQAQYPSKPVQVILPLQAGSASDVAVRLVVEKMGERLKQSFAVENVTGAAGMIGADRLVKAGADGYTLGALNNSILTILPNVRRGKVGFDPFTDFIPIAGLAVIPTFLGVNKDLPVSTVQELIALAKARPGALNYASGGAGSPQHLATEMFQAFTGVSMTHVPYKGATQATTDLAAGQVQVMFVAQALALPHLPSGRVKFIGFAGPQRSSAYPNVPTLQEAGVANYEYSSWIALFAPKGTPPAALKVLRDGAAAVLADAVLAERFAKGGLDMWNLSAERLAAVIRDDHARWARVVTTANISTE